MHYCNPAGDPHADAQAHRSRSHAYTDAYAFSDTNIKPAGE